MSDPVASYRVPGTGVGVVCECVGRMRDLFAGVSLIG
jgi:hypothetical protein